MLRRIAIVITAIGTVAAIAGWIWNAVDAAPDANIGAGMLVVVGLPVAGIGLVLLVASALLARRGRTT